MRRVTLFLARIAQHLDICDPHAPVLGLLLRIARVGRCLLRIFVQVVSLRMRFDTYSAYRVSDMGQRA